MFHIIVYVFFLFIGQVDSWCLFGNMFPFIHWLQSLGGPPQAAQVKIPMLTKTN